MEGPAGSRDLGHEKGQYHILGPYDWRTTEEKRSPKQPDHDIAGGRQSQKENELSGGGTIQRRWGRGLYVLKGVGLVMGRRTAQC